MDISINNRILLILILPVLIFCGGEQESEQQVDQNYIDSQEYSNFSEDATREGEASAKNNVSMEVRLQKLAECEDITQMELPLKVDDQEILADTEDSAENCSVEDDLQTLKLIGESRFQNQTIRWVVLERQTAYRDQELLATTFRENELQGFTTVGVFKKNPSEEIMAEIEVRNKGNTLHVISRTTRKILYPIEQENITTTEYQVDTGGSIREL